MRQEDDQLSDEEALKAFLLDIECLAPLNKWTARFNLFDILKITRTEIRHSNVLAWLLSPDENHGLGDRVLRGIIQYVVSREQHARHDVFRTLLMDLHTFRIEREWRNIDIMAVSDEEKLVLCIENKIDAGEHDDQLNRYRGIVNESYPGYRMMYLFLSPQGMSSSDDEHWVPIGYNDILRIITEARQQVELPPDAALLISNYIDTIRRDIVGDEELRRICEEIYARHGKALDLIFQHRPSRAAGLSEQIIAWASGKEQQGALRVDQDKLSKTFIRFKTPFMSSLLPNPEKGSSGWNNTSFYYYEINIRAEEITFQLTLSGSNIPDDLRAMCDRIHELHPSRNKKQDWQWRTPFAAEHIRLQDDTEETLSELLDQRFDALCSFEARLKEELGM